MLSGKGRSSHFRKIKDWGRVLHSRILSRVVKHLHNLQRQRLQERPRGVGGLTAWLTRPLMSQNLTSRREMRSFEAQPSVMYHFDSSQENAAASPSAGPMRPIESPSVRPLASGATLGNAPVEDVAMSLTASIVFPSAEAPAGAVSHPHRISTAPGMRSNV